MASPWAFFGQGTGVAVGIGVAVGGTTTGGGAAGGGAAGGGGLHVFGKHALHPFEQQHCLLSKPHVNPAGQLLVPVHE